MVLRWKLSTCRVAVCGVLLGRGMTVLRGFLQFRGDMKIIWSGS
jgi:hypothetical protein